MKVVLLKSQKHESHRSSILKTRCELTKCLVFRIQKFLDLTDSAFNNDRVKSRGNSGLLAQILALEPLHDQITRFILWCNHGIDNMLLEMASIKWIPWCGNL